ncbi:hypothetical protein C4B60_20935 [Jeotgalibacillus proteolyticus]|uniref:Uncharacterized protein n=1 Tax=Jeotgalibacillus proteolyticus TaxID=2082395 RepID=A0A2S5G667_9BACL|nr:hypothetical protein C4B60_20935 [Jeotgalibacillus proteolyticus]
MNKIYPQKEISIHLAKYAYKIINLPFHVLFRELINAKYRALLRERNFFSASNKIHQQDIYQDFKHKLSSGF